MFNRLKWAWLALTASKNDPRYKRWLMAPAPYCGVPVDHDSALTTSAVFRAVSFVSQSVAGLPWQVIKEDNGRTTVMDMHYLAPILSRQANDEMSAYDWRQTMIAWALTWGNGYSEIEQDAAGRPVALWPISPDRVEVKRTSDTQEIVYEINNYQGGNSYLPKDRMFHLKGLGFDGLVGYSVISLAARSIGLSLASEQYAGDYFANATVSTGVIRHPKELSNEAHEKLRKDFADKNSKFGRKWTPLILEEGMDWQSLSVPPEDSQLLETRKFQVNDIARWFGIPPHKLADLERATFSNIEHQSIEVVNDAFLPWVHRLEQEAAIKLLPARLRNTRTKINIRGLLRGDNKSRAEYYQIMRRVGAYSSNDIRALEDMNPEGPEADELIVESNMITLKQLANGENLKPDPNQPDEPDPPVPPGQALLPTIQDIFNRILRREQGQFDQSSHKFQGDLAKFNEWADSFYPKHQLYMTEALTPAIESLRALLPGSNGASALNGIVEAHIMESRENLENMAGGYDGWNSQTRASVLATRLIEAVVKSNLESVDHGENT